MKKYNFNSVRNLLLAVAMVGSGSMLFTSCEDTLDLPSYTKDDTDFAFRDENNADLFVQGIYNGLVHEEFYRQVNTGETTTIAAEDNFEGQKHYVSNYAFDPTAPYVFGSTYGESYKKIEACNLALSYLRDMEQTAKIKALIAEVSAQRAFLYFNLIRLFGDVPFTAEPLDPNNMYDEDVMYPKRYDRDKIYDFIINDMVATIEDLPWYSECGYTERINRNSACGLLARICLHAAGYSLRWNLETNDPATLHMGTREDQARIREIYIIADNALKSVITQGENYLIQGDNDMSGFMKLFYSFTGRDLGTVAPEMMWSIARLGENVGNTTLGVYVGTTGGSQYSIYGARRSLQAKLPTYYLSFDPADTRRDVTCCNYTVRSLSLNADKPDVADAGATFSSIAPGKYRIQWQVEPNAAAKRNVNIPMVRYADVLLMYAETQNWLNNGPTQEARTALQQVRDRAGIGHMAIPSSQDEFQDAILQERKWELSDEFLLRTDLVRMNLLDREVHKAQQDLKDLSKREGAYAGIPKFRLYKFTKDENKYRTKFLTLEYIDLTDAAEIAKVDRTIPTTGANRENFMNDLKAIATAHGKDGSADWCATNMFLSWDNTYNKNGRIAGGFKAGGENNQMLLGNTIAQKPTGYAENKDKFPDWIEGPFGLYFGYKHNQTELSPFANKSAGHPLVDNPRLTQLPGYPGYSGLPN
ncbi:MAG: RagB/SusD family nutrient uptake outer membrane protein [Duncaniella sp.]|nr:RagB/SusD family nutrient uptake outer membrane protein [Duncaniella sp.]